MAERRDYAVFVLSHQRADDLRTATMLEKWYTGEWFIIIDDEDTDAEKYFEKWGDRVIQFCKKEVADQTDTCDLDDDRRVGVFARNFIIDEAKRRGYKYHLQLDDDFLHIRFKYVENGKRIGSKICTHLDLLFDAMCTYLKETEITWLSFGLSSYYLGGLSNQNWHKGLLRKTMGSFFMNTEKAPHFFCRMNDDITTNAVWTFRGAQMFSIMPVQVDTFVTQAQEGGMTEIYKENGTYRKSFYSLLNAPSFATIATQGRIDFRVHHQIAWAHCAPMILNERWRKCTTT